MAAKAGPSELQKTPATGIEPTKGPQEKKLWGPRHPGIAAGKANITNPSDCPRQGSPGKFATEKPETQIMVGEATCPGGDDACQTSSLSFQL
jgi:hypothetical protein